MASPPRLDEFCSTHFRYRDVVECGATWHQLAKAGTPVDNVPRQTATWAAITRLCVDVLDPLVEHLGPIELTYGFASAALTRHIVAGIAPRLDQHAGHEVLRTGRPICKRLGQAVDLRIPRNPAVDVASWLVANTPFDRLYIYGPDRPLHVSCGPDNSRVVVELRTTENGRRYPARTMHADDWLAKHH